MMRRSIFLARLIGPIFVVMGIGLLANNLVYRALAQEFLASHALIYLSGLLSMTAGLAIVLMHNVWTKNWRVIITLLGWLGTFGGALRILAPQWVTTVGTAIMARAVAPIIGGIVIVTLGAVLSYFGYSSRTSFMGAIT